jgi:hypothetical protein
MPTTQRPRAFWTPASDGYCRAHADALRALGAGDDATSGALADAVEATCQDGIVVEKMPPPWRSAPSGERDDVGGHAWFSSTVRWINA